MSSRRRAAAAFGCLAGVGLAAFGALDAAAAPAQETEQPARETEQAPPQPACSDNPASWGCAWDEGFVDGMTFDGDAITLSGTFRPPVGELTRVHAVLTPENAGPSCPVKDAEQLFTEDGTTTTTTPTSAPDDATVAFSLENVLPLCNDVYDIEVRAYTAPVAAEENEEASPPLALHGVRVVLRPPSPEGPLVVERANEQDPVVRLSWAPPEEWAAGTPPGFLGYRVEQALGSGPFETLDTPVGTSLEVNPFASWAGEGTYRYRVVTVRKESDVVESANLLTSPPEHAPSGELQLAAPTTTDTARPPSTPTFGSGGRPGGRSGGVPVGGTVAPDSGFSEVLDYSGFEFGREEAVPPEDATSFIELEDEEAPASPVARPIAIASVLAMWAFHLRYLSRRADQAA